jgi:antitoxin (DNA-binding transcriptional repressor) of toxin-antitoxin stability system
MNTITTKKLRESMPQIIRDLRQGKSIQLSYRHTVIGVLQPAQQAQKTLRRGSPESIRQGLHNLQKITVPSHVSRDSRSIKDQVREMRGRKYRR